MNTSDLLHSHKQYSKRVYTSTLYSRFNYKCYDLVSSHGTSIVCVTRFTVGLIFLKMMGKLVKLFESLQFS